METSIKTAAANAPSELADVTGWLRYTEGDEDTLITQVIIPAATQTLEDWLNRKLITQVHYAYLEEREMCDLIELPFGNLQSVEEIVYIPSSESSSDFSTATTIASSNYYAQTKTWLGFVELEPDGAWPTDAKDIKYPYRIEFTCGYGAAKTNLPEALRTAHLMICELYFNNRSLVKKGIKYEDAPMTLQLLVEMNRIHKL